ncbi:DgyrCDS14415 [Dimorphilus gyrociliatus]|uniref:DgyrCDS14415 n=1 Tax=Dimorphilus gyrociliatus TaxID=2664684 RepID=A0A7I8WDX0_9ANNE|nr:DgyrCDS14415 [Dimorphilus gyrociliatus]
MTTANRTSEYELSIQDSSDGNVYVEGILKGKMLIEDDWLIVKYEIFTTQQNNLLCERMGYESIHSVALPFYVEYKMGKFNVILDKIPRVYVHKSCKFRDLKVSKTFGVSPPIFFQLKSLKRLCLQLCFHLKSIADPFSCFEKPFQYKETTAIACKDDIYIRRKPSFENIIDTCFYIEGTQESVRVIEPHCQKPRKSGKH